RCAPHLRRLGGVSKAEASCRNPERSEGSLSAMKLMSRNILFSWPYGEQCLAVFHRLSVVDQHFYYFAGDVGLDFIHELHGFNDANPLACRYLVARLDKRQRARRGRLVEGANNRRLYLVQFLFHCRIG